MRERLREPARPCARAGAAGLVRALRAARADAVTAPYTPGKQGCPGVSRFDTTCSMAGPESPGAHDDAGGAGGAGAGAASTEGGEAERRASARIRAPRHKVRANAPLAALPRVRALRIPVCVPAPGYAGTHAARHALGAQRGATGAGGWITAPVSRWQAPPAGLFSTVFFQHGDATETLRIGGRTLRRVHADPNIYLIDGFLTEPDIEHLDSLITPAGFVKSYTDAENGKKVVDEYRTSTFVHLGKSCDTCIRNIESRAANMIGMPPDMVEPLQVVKYSEGTTCVARGRTPLVLRAGV